MKELKDHNHNGINSEKIKSYSVIPTYRLTTTQLNTLLTKKSIEGDEFNVYNTTTNKYYKYVMINGDWKVTELLNEVAVGEKKVYGKMYLYGSQTISANSTTTVNLNAREVYENITANISSHRFEIEEDGYYLVTGQILYGSSVNEKYYDAYLYKNSTMLVQSRSHASDSGVGISTLISDIVYLEDGDYVYLKTRHNESSSTSLAQNYTMMLIQKL